VKFHTVPPGDKPIAVNKYNISYHTACNAHAPHCNLCPVWFYYNFQQYHINARIFWKDVVEYKMCVLIFSTNFYGSFLIVTRTEQDIINVLMSSCKVPVILLRF